MPLIAQSSYRKAPLWQWNGHLQTIMPALTRGKIRAPWERERLELSDGDFVDLDWLAAGVSRRLVLLSHGLEGNSQRSYIQGMARFFHLQGWDALAWNCRSCSGEMNRKLRLYHHGEIEDLGEVVRHALRTKDYEQIVLIGFSMGGSMLLKYLGVHGRHLPPAVRKGIAFSAPCDLEASIRALEQPGNKFYCNRFYKRLRAKIERKAQQFPQAIDLSKFEQVRCWRDFDQFFSVPINGFASVEEFYYQASCVHFMEGIRIPALLVNAQNDPILAPECSPRGLCERHPYIFLEMPRQGGHVGFTVHRHPYSWMEYRAETFVAEGR